MAPRSTFKQLFEKITGKMMIPELCLRSILCGWVGAGGVSTFVASSSSSNDGLDCIPARSGSGTNFFSGIPFSVCFGEPSRLFLQKGRPSY